MYFPEVIRSGSDLPSTVLPPIRDDEQEERDNQSPSSSAIRQDGMENDDERLPLEGDEKAGAVPEPDARCL